MSVSEECRVDCFAIRLREKDELDKIKRQLIKRSFRSLKLNLKTRA